MDVVKETQLSRYLTVRIQANCCVAIPLQNVMEICRPLPTQTLIDAPAFVRGVAIVRSIPTPVIDLALVLGLAAAPDPNRFVILRAGAKPVAVAVASVIGVAEVPTEALWQFSPLLGSAPDDVVDRIGELDGDLLFVLSCGRLISNDLADTLCSQAAES